MVFQKDFNLRVPLPSERKEIILKSHLLGHFAAHTVHNKLKEKYYWRNMINDINLVISQCGPCVRHQKVRVEEQPAIAIPITGIFDRVGLDCIFGLPISNGYVGILVIMEYLSKYPYAVPIRSKTAEEIAQKFFIYISMFGPPKEIISDQGREFVNKIMKEITMISGVEHRVTSSYHPRTNGLTERFNGTLIRSLKKHAEKDPEDWPNWIPYVLMSYRIRSNDITKYSPFELMFGRQMNTFQDYDKEDVLNEELTLAEDGFDKRALELKRLYEGQVPEVLDTIDEAQYKQKLYQNKRMNVKEDLLEVGTKVTIKVMRIQPKMFPNYNGIFTIKGLTPENNYWLESEDGILLKNSYPRSRLKVVSIIENEQINKIECIKKHRVDKGRLQYFIIWTNNDGYWEDEGSIEPEITEKYWSQLGEIPTAKKIELIPPPKRGRPRKSDMKNENDSNDKNKELDNNVEQLTLINPPNYKGPLTRSKAKKMALYSKWNWLHKMILIMVLICLISKAEATVKLFNKKVCDIKLSFNVWESFDFCNKLDKLIRFNRHYFIDLSDIKELKYTRLIINETHFKWLSREKRFDLWKVAGKAYDLTIKSPVKIIKEVIYVSKDLTNIVRKGMSFTSKLIITFLSVLSISIITITACIYKCNLMRRIKNKIC